MPPGEGPRTRTHAYLPRRQAGELLAGGAAVQALDVAQETLRLLDFGQELVHVPAGTDLGVAGAVSHVEVTQLWVARQAGPGGRPRRLLKPRGTLFRAGGRRGPRAGGGAGQGPQTHEDTQPL